VVARGQSDTYDSHTRPSRASGAAGDLRPSRYSLWEVGKKVQLGKISLPKDLSAWFAGAVASNVEVLPLERGVVIEAMRLPEFLTRDPADELIVASARLHNLTLVTTDIKLKGYRHARVNYFKALSDRDSS